MVAFDKYEPGYSVYPGAYMPLLEEGAMKDKLKSKDRRDIIHPPIVITDMRDAYRIEVNIPGVKREEFLVQVESNCISVSVVHHLPASFNNEKQLLNEIDCTCFVRHIFLPGNADATFAIAEYREGVLNIYVPKNPTPSLNASARLAVY
jgi:HSP20 family protein